jgi:hypothetical protein
MDNLGGGFAMNTPAARAPTPLLYWIVAAISLLWNSFGGYDYLMTKLRNLDYLKSAVGGDAQLAQKMLETTEALPVWVHFLWGLGVWSSVLGSLLLLARSRHAVPVFLVSLVAAGLSFAYQFTLTMPPGLDTPMMKVMPLVILAAIVLQWWWARRKVADGTLG